MVVVVGSADDRPLLSGVLTFLMTDVVDSTLLWESAPGLMDGALTRHDQIIEAAVTMYDGVLLKHRGEGDSTFCVFGSASEATAAAIEAQRRLAAETWDEATPMSVRMGIHTGESILRGRDYYGQTINRTARVRAVAVGGQVLLSSTTAALVGASLPTDTELRFLRHEKLRGIERPEAIHEVVDRRRPEPVERVVALPPSWPLPPLLDEAIARGFSGRAAMIAELERLLGAAGRGQPQMVMLGGEPGAGKSTLAAKIAKTAHDAGWVVLAGACDPGASSPYQPFRETFSAYVESAPSAVLAQHITEHGGEIARLAPKLSARVGAVTPVEAVDPETTRQLLIEAAADLVERAAADRPLMIVLEDLQWADRNALLLVRRLARLSPTTPVMILGTYRSGSADQRDLGDALLDLASSPRFTDLSVEGLDESDLLALLEQRAGHRIANGSAFTKYLLDQTGGNAFFATELLRHFADTGVIGNDEGTWAVKVDLDRVAVPGTVRSVLQQRVGRLPDEAQRVLGVASVAGRKFDTKLLASVVGRPEIDVLDAVESAAASGLVREVTVGQFEFAHALVRLTVYDELGATRRGLYHRHLAEAIESELGERAPAAVLADHWSSTGRDESAKIAFWSHRAGEAAMAGLAPDEATRWFRRALDASGDDERGRLQILVALGDAQRWAGGDAFRRTLLDAAALAQRLGDNDALVRAALANNRGGTSASGVVDEERVAVLERALDVVGSHDSPARACLLATLSIELSQSDDAARRIALADDAVACARRLGDDVTLLKVLTLTTEATRQPTTLDRRLTDTDELFALAMRLGDPVLLGIAAVRQIRVKIEAAMFDQIDDALRILDEVASLSPYVRWNRLILQACLAHVRGDIPLALTTATEAREIAIADGQPDAVAVYVAQIADMYWDTGALGSLLPMIERTVRDNPNITGFRAFLGLAYSDAGRFDDARAVLAHEVATGFAEHSVSPVWLMTISLFASLAIELDDARGAHLLYEMLTPWRGRANATTVSTNGLVTESLAGLALACGRLDQSQRDCDEALEQSRRVGARVSEVRTVLTQARLRLARGHEGDVAAAIGELERVKNEASTMGLASILRQADKLLALTAARPAEHA